MVNNVFVVGTDFDGMGRRVGDLVRTAPSRALSATPLRPAAAAALLQREGPRHCVLEPDFAADPDDARRFLDVVDRLNVGVTLAVDELRMAHDMLRWIGGRVKMVTCTRDVTDRVGDVVGALGPVAAALTLAGHGWPRFSSVRALWDGPDRVTLDVYDKSRVLRARHVLSTGRASGRRKHEVEFGLGGAALVWLRLDARPGRRDEWRVVPVPVGLRNPDPDEARLLWTEEFLARADGGAAASRLPELDRAHAIADLVGAWHRAGDDPGRHVALR